MKKIINGKRYNTETAEKIANYWNGLGRGDFNTIEETLYRTKNGAWFLECYGGAGTGYAERTGNMSSEGSGIKPLDEDEAYQWLDDHQETEMIEKHLPNLIKEA